jgi:hypothetical protein
MGPRRWRRPRCRPLPRECRQESSYDAESSMIITDITAYLRYCDIPPARRPRAVSRFRKGSPNAHEEVRARRHAGMDARKDASLGLAVKVYKHVSAKDDVVLSPDPVVCVHQVEVAEHDTLANRRLHADGARVGILAPKAIAALQRAGYFLRLALGIYPGGRQRGARRPRRRYPGSCSRSARATRCGIPPSPSRGLCLLPGRRGDRPQAQVLDPG